jgi:hypothetical protein
MLERGDKTMHAGDLFFKLSYMRQRQLLHFAAGTIPVIPQPQ